MVFSQVNKISLPPTTGFQTLFQPVITDVAEHLSQLLKENLHSIYVYGSVANGCAIAEKSDLDICLILKNKIDKFENQQLDKTRVMLGTLYPIVSKIDFDIGVLSKVLAPNNLYSWGYWLKHHCRCIFSDELTEITRATHTWLFPDGIVLKCTEEIETEHYDNDAQCPEHWITWEIVESNNKPISPYRKEFFNLCQQSFWLKMQLSNNK
ncbi:hypothetical protein GWJ01_06850 [Proteus sp. G2618]|uniref:nucleotidyltransferase domain-containing protein n=1 Tax=Proteus TaxID=583 RepID=UPI0013767CFA|nr:MULTISPECIES: nucleotidyltransferase domain-containing protein [Proteus]MCE9840868.1 nucleotidyltransferase domain-containing protein [Proteus terrae]NBN70822.1 hypothetical protein [Proteus sp. G2618]